MWWLVILLAVGAGLYLYTLSSRSKVAKSADGARRAETATSPAKKVAPAEEEERESQVLVKFTNKAFSQNEGDLKPGMIPGCGGATIAALKKAKIYTGAQLYGLYLLHGGTDKSHGDFVAHVKSLNDDLKHNNFIYDIAKGLQAKYSEMRRF